MEKRKELVAHNQIRDYSFNVAWLCHEKREETAKIAHDLLCRNCKSSREHCDDVLSTALFSSCIHCCYETRTKLFTVDVPPTSDSSQAVELAIKIVKCKPGLMYEKWLDRSIRELLIATTVSKDKFEYIICTYGGYYLNDKKTFVLISEYAAMGDLFDYILTYKPNYSDNQAWFHSIFTQLVLAVKYLHSVGILHMDLKLENVLVFENGNKVKLCDFGLSLFKKEANECMHRAGTLHYCAPELFLSSSANDSFITEAVDLWGLGCILFTMLFRVLPFTNVSDGKLEKDEEKYVIKIRDRILKGDYHVSPDFHARHREVCDIVYGLLTVQPDLRLTIDEVMGYDCIKQAIVQLHK